MFSGTWSHYGTGNERKSYRSMTTFCNKSFIFISHTCVYYTFISNYFTYFMSTQQLNVITAILSLTNVCITTNIVTELCSLDVFCMWSLKFQVYAGRLTLRLKNGILFFSPQTK